MKGQRATLKISDTEGNPFENAAIYLGNKILGYSNSLGLFQTAISNEYYFIRHPNYWTKKLKIHSIDTQEIFLKPKTNEFQTFVINPKRKPELNASNAKPIFTVNSRQLQSSLPTNSADAIGANGDAYIQKSQLGGGSPMMRGFAANRILLMVDGVRLNHALFRSGNLHNILMIDPYSIENVEISSGANSVLYGSDALGGVIHTQLISPNFDQRKKVGGKISSYYFSPSNGQIIHGDLHLMKKRFFSLSSITRQKFNSLKMGANGPREYQRDAYIRNVNNRDSIFENKNPNEQIGTAYQQINFLQKFAYKWSNQLSFHYGFYGAQTSEIPRYDRLILKNQDESLVNALWNYTPQKWFMNRLEIRSSNKNFLSDRINLIYAHQFNKEGRMIRKYKSNDQNVLSDGVHAHSVNFDVMKKIHHFRFYYGAEWVFNRVQSEGVGKDIYTGKERSIQSRYPNNSTWTSSGLYTKLKKHWIEKNMFMDYGARVSLVASQASLGDFFKQEELNNISQKNWNISQSLGWVKWYGKKYKFAFNLSSGFRAPNLDDLSKVFDSEPGKVIVPNTSLKPEKTYNADISWQANFVKKNQVFIGFFYTYLKDAMARANGQLNGSDSFLYLNVLSQIQRLENIESAAIYGARTKFRWILKREFVLHGQLSLIAGQQSNGQAVRHITPNFGQIALRKYFGKNRVELICLWNGQLSNNQLAISEQSKPHIYALNSQGKPFFPSWTVFHFRSQYVVFRKHFFQLNFENILNQRYRTYSSGLVSPGRGVNIGFTFRL